MNLQEQIKKLEKEIAKISFDPNVDYSALDAKIFEYWDLKAQLLNPSTEIGAVQ